MIRLRQPNGKQRRDDLSSGRAVETWVALGGALGDSGGEENGAGRSLSAVLIVSRRPAVASNYSMPRSVSKFSKSPAGIFLRTSSKKRCTAFAVKWLLMTAMRIFLDSGHSSIRTVLRVPRRSSSWTKRRDRAESPKPAPTRRLIVSGHHTSMSVRTWSPFVSSQRVTSCRVSEEASR